MVQALLQLQNLIDHLTESNKQPDSPSSEAERTRALQYAWVMKQWLTVNAAEVLPKADAQDRSMCMAENLIYLIDQARPAEKFIIWQHNWHISLDAIGDGRPTMGYILRAKLGPAYFAFGFEFGEGAFQTRAELPDKTLGDLKEFTSPAAPIGSLPWYLSRTGVGNLILRLRVPTGNEVVEQWLETPQTVHNAGWVNQEDIYHKYSIARSYDGVIYVDRTTASRPTMNALQTVARREGL